MILERVPERDSVIHRLDPRVRILLALAASIYPLMLHALHLLAASALAALILCLAARIPIRSILARLAALNLFMAALLVFLPWGTPGEPLWTIGPLAYSWEGVIRTLQIALRAHAIVLALTAFIGAMEPVTFGHALGHLRVPKKLILLFLFTVRYIAVLESEYTQLRRAMVMRAFEPRLNRHTLHTYGNLVGMLLVRAIDRSERINEAMKCRAFTGRFPSFHHFQMGARDAIVATLLIIAATTLLIIQWT